MTISLAIHGRTQQQRVTKGCSDKPHGQKICPSYGDYDATVRQNVPVSVFVVAPDSWLLCRPYRALGFVGTFNNKLNEAERYEKNEIVYFDMFAFL